MTVLAITIILNVLLYAIPFTSSQFNLSQNSISFRDEKYHHEAALVAKDHITDQHIYSSIEMSNITNMNEILDNICIPRVVGSQNHKAVSTYIKNSMSNLGWTVETDKFSDVAPILGELEFENIIAKLNPSARRYLVLACHYDSKYIEGKEFVGATDSAVPCAQMINLATVMKENLNSIKQQDVSLMFIFFDGEEAFRQWGPTDSIYGARHLSKKWHTTESLYKGESISELDKMDVLVLLDLIGTSNPKFYDYFNNQVKLYYLLPFIETKLKSVAPYLYKTRRQRYFHNAMKNAFIDDDHTPFLSKNVPILHVIPTPFPECWHKLSDNRDIVDMRTVENINIILRMFVALYLNISI